MGDEGTSLDRRTVLKTLAGTTAAAGLAGCGGNGGGGDGTTTDGGGGGDGGGGDTTTDGGGGGDTTTDDGGGEQQLGERVPPLVVQFLPGFGPWGDATEPIVTDLREALDHEIQPEPVEVAAFLEASMTDNREYHFQTWGWDSQPTNFDAGRNLRSFAVDNAGAEQAPNWANYANCEFSKGAVRQLSMGDAEERLALLKELQSMYSMDRAELSIVSNDTLAAGRNDMVEFNSLGQAGITVFNPKFFIDSTPKNGDRWVFGTSQTLADTVNHLQESSTASAILWHQLVHSPLFIFDENRERQPELAESVDTNDDGTEITIQLADATFHNGDPVTSEDVKFTLEFIQANEVALATDIPYESIETPNDSTVEITLQEPAPLFLGMYAALWGILHKPTWEGVDDLSNFQPTEMIGSGPFQLESFTQGQSVTLTPHDGHPRHSPGHGLVLFVFSDNQTKRRALRENEIQVAGQLTGAGLSQLSNQMGDTLFENVSKGIGAWKLIGAYPRDPIFRPPVMDAIGMSINRQQINEIVFNGMATPVLHSGMYLQRHPQSPSEENLHFYTDDPTGDPEGARQRLTEAGFGWDDNNNLRYPADVDPAPLWPKGENPSPDDYPCLNQDGEIVLDEES